ncbi:MAG: LptF/LptG family permease [Lentisphaeria bacterium]|nr:LptF/LptG family permease [Lentisphaeria bacterium]
MLKTLNWYIAKNFVVTFITAIAVLTFGMTGARLIKVFEYISAGVDSSAAFQFLLYILPVALSFTIPWASLVSIMLVFGRLSADNEITAMRACGVSILQIVAPIIAIVFLLSCLCLYIQLEVGPVYLSKSRDVVKNVALDSPLALFRPGLPLQFDDLQVMIDSKDEDGTIHGVQIYRMDGDELQQDISASVGRIRVDEQAQELFIELENTVIIDYLKDGREQERPTAGKSWIKIEYGKKFNQITVMKRDKFEGFRELYARVVIARKANMKKRVCELETELNQRVALALSPIAFLLLGLPMAIRTSRRETSVGLFMSVLLAGVYFGAILVANVLSSVTWAYPQYLVWIAPILYQGFGAYYIFHIAKR